jgi:hypothetical protein
MTGSEHDGSGDDVGVRRRRSAQLDGDPTSEGQEKAYTLDGLGGSKDRRAIQRTPLLRKPTQSVKLLRRCSSRLPVLRRG